MDTLELMLKLLAIVATVAASVVVALIGLLGSIKLKQLEHEMRQQDEKEARKLRVHLPILRFFYELDRRLGHILHALDKDWLQQSYLDEVKAKRGFAADPVRPGYFILSTLYLLACFFGWSEIIKRTGDIARTPPTASTLARLYSRLRQWIRASVGWKEPFRFDPQISTISKLFQYEEMFSDLVKERQLQAPVDACKLHKQLQYSIGELMIEVDESGISRCKNFREFFEAYVTDEKFRYWLTMLEKLVGNLCLFDSAPSLEQQVCRKADLRPLRLLAIRFWCRMLMKNIGAELEVTTPSPDDVLNGISESTKKAIVGLKVEELEAYLLEPATAKQ